VIGMHPPGGPAAQRAGDRRLPGPRPHPDDHALVNYFVDDQREQFGKQSRDHAAIAPASACPTVTKHSGPGLPPFLRQSQYLDKLHVDRILNGELFNLRVHLNPGDIVNQLFSAARKGGY
jgi:hypothetical protein